MPDQPLPDVHDRILGADPGRPLDLLLINAPLRDYSLRPRLTDYTLPVIGMGYIATYAAQAGHNVGLLDAEAHGLGIEETIRSANAAAPRWVGLNLLAPTYELSARIAAGLDSRIRLMVGGHHAKAAPQPVLADPRMSSLAALVVADRHDHLAHEIIPRLDAGITVVCDRYVASTLVVQALDGVRQQYLLDLNAGMRVPDLSVILTADPGAIAARIARRGATHRFNRDVGFPARETALYQEAGGILRGMGVPVLAIDTVTASPGAVAEQIAAHSLGVTAKVPQQLPRQGATPQ